VRAVSPFSCKNQLPSSAFRLPLSSRHSQAKADFVSGQHDGPAFFCHPQPMKNATDIASRFFLVRGESGFMGTRRHGHLPIFAVLAHRLIDDGVWTVKSDSIRLDPSESDRIRPLKKFANRTHFPASDRPSPIQSDPVRPSPTKSDRIKPNQGELSRKT
jgi:hypothetical protein